MGIWKRTMESRAGTVGGVAVMALVWAVIWALPGGAIEALDNIAPAAHGFTRQVDMWMQTLGLPGLIAGVAFSVLLLVTDARRRFAEVGLGRAAAWGALAGLLVAVLVVWVMDTGLSEPAGLAAVLTGYATLMGVTAGIGSVLLFRHQLRRLGSTGPGDGAASHARS